MELKLFWNVASVPDDTSFNQTRMELKQRFPGYQPARILF